MNQSERKLTGGETAVLLMRRDGISGSEAIRIVGISRATLDKCPAYKAYREERSEKLQEMANSGVYKITNTINGKCYIGSSKNIHIRMRDHKIALKSGSHGVKCLQDDWDSHGAENFDFEVLIYVSGR
jgi:hypothetical protein